MKISERIMIYVSSSNYVCCERNRYPKTQNAKTHPSLVRCCCCCLGARCSCLCISSGCNVLLAERSASCFVPTHVRFECRVLFNSSAAAAVRFGFEYKRPARLYTTHVTYVLATLPKTTHIHHIMHYIYIPIYTIIIPYIDLHLRFASLTLLFCGCCCCCCCIARVYFWGVYVVFCVLLLLYMLFVGGGVDEAREVDAAAKPQTTTDSVVIRSLRFVASLEL